MRKAKQMGIKGSQNILLLTLIVYLCSVLWYTVLNRGERFQYTELELFWSYRLWLAGDVSIGWKIILNIALFVPYGFLLLSLLGGRKKTLTVLSASVFSLVIESLQMLLIRGLFEVDDILNNTLGASIGCLCYYGLKRLVPIKISNLVVVLVCIVMMTVSVFVISLDHVVDEDDSSRSFCFQVDDAVIDENELIMTGFLFDVDKKMKQFSIVLQDIQTGEKVLLDTQYGLVREDVSYYFSEGRDYTHTGFVASGRIEPSAEYEVLLQLPWFASISSGVYMAGEEMHSLPLGTHAVPKLWGTSLERIIDDGYLHVYCPEHHCWVYQYKGALYWITEPGFFFEDDQTTYIQYHLHTTQTEKLPQHRLDNNWLWDNIGGYFEDYELSGDFGVYRVMKRELPTEYPIMSITTGYYREGAWVWKAIFRPRYFN